ncbi:hypothetical protein SAMN05444817_1071, partial [Corynebacterium appendicis CIP 107643]
MTAAPHSIDPATYLDDLLAQASPDLMRQMLQGFINQILSAQADTVCGAEYGGPDPLVVDTLKPASRWESEVPFHHATQDLHRA